MSTFREHSLYEIYELWRIGRTHAIALAQKSTPRGVPHLAKWIQEVDVLLEVGLDGDEFKAIAAAMNQMRAGRISSGSSVDFAQLVNPAFAVVAQLRLFVRHPDNHRFKQTRAARRELLLCLQAALDLFEDDLCIGAANTISDLSAAASMPIEATRRVVAYLVDNKLAYFCEEGDHTRVSEEFSIEYDRAERQLHRWNIEGEVSITSRIEVECPKELPSEWKELVSGIAGKYEFKATPHLLGSSLLVDLETYSDADHAKQTIPLIAAELEAVLRQPSRLADSLATQNTFVNSGQAGAMGPGAVATGNTFQQLNISAPDKAEQARLANELEKLREALRGEAADPQHFAELSAVAKAQLEAGNGNGEEALTALSGAGRWSLGIAQKIGIPVAVKWIEKVLDL